MLHRSKVAGKFFVVNFVVAQLAPVFVAGLGTSI